MGDSFLGRIVATRIRHEGNHMVQAASPFNQLLHHFPRTEFAALVKKHGAERAAKGFTCWTQFVSMLFCQLGWADSLWEICNGLACSQGRRLWFSQTPKLLIRWALVQTRRAFGPPLTALDGVFDAVRGATRCH
ncbi:MAG: DUF4372 domain-containing protein [Acidobacteria bacterium]|nr:DUF4372 domain-containing protein [Acidobacteriota bacterium]